MEAAAEREAVVCVCAENARAHTTHTHARGLKTNRRSLGVRAARCSGRRVVGERAEDHFLSLLSGCVRPWILSLFSFFFFFFVSLLRGALLRLSAQSCDMRPRRCGVDYLCSVL